MNDSTGSTEGNWIYPPEINYEESFCDNLREDLVKTFGVPVHHYSGFDEAGEVYGSPDEIELDYLVVNDRNVVVEIGFEISRSQVYSLERSVRFFEKTNGTKVSNVIILTLIIAPKDVALAEELGIKVYSNTYSICL
jgi:hypothetical protein